MFRNRHGQALIELAAFVLLTTSLVTAFLGFTKAFAIRQDLLLAAREGMLLYSSGHFTENEIDARLKSFLASSTPALDPARVQTSAHAVSGITARFVGMDVITVRYTTNSTWVRRLGLNPTLEETCYIKHANSYGPSLPALWGPPVRPS